MIENTDLVAAGERALHVLQPEHCRYRQAFLAQPLQFTVFGAERNRIRAACQAIGQLPPIPDKPRPRFRENGMGLVICQLGTS